MHKYFSVTVLQWKTTIGVLRLPSYQVLQAQILCPEGTGVKATGGRYCGRLGPSTVNVGPLVGSIIHQGVGRAVDCRAVDHVRPVADADRGADRRASLVAGNAAVVCRAAGRGAYARVVASHRQSIDHAAGAMSARITS